MGKMSSGLLAWVVMLFACAGCSVKEDREVCPGRLMLDFSGVDASVGSLALLVTGPDGVALRDVIVSSDFKENYVREVPHGMLNVNIDCGADDFIDEEYGLVIPVGCECPPVYMQSFTADTRGEIYCKKVELHKNHCCLTVKLRGRDVMPYNIAVRGSVDGYALDGSPRRGEFCCLAYPEDSVITVKVPRQMDASLMLEVEDENGISKSFAIGEYIMASGYDWNAEDLSDITVTLDYYITGVTVLVQKWDDEFVFDLVL